MSENSHTVHILVSASWSFKFLSNNADSGNGKLFLVSMGRSRRMNHEAGLRRVQTLRVKVLV